MSLMKKKTTSIKIDPELWKEAKKYCIDEEVDVSEFVENLIRKALSDTKTTGKMKSEAKAVERTEKSTSGRP